MSLGIGIPALYGCIGMGAANDPPGLVSPFDTVNWCWFADEGVLFRKGVAGAGSRAVPSWLLIAERIAI
jgi:hypothetical protein